MDGRPRQARGRRGRPIAPAFATVLVGALLAGAVLVGTAGPAAAATSPAIAPPPPGAAFDYQLGGAYAPPDGVQVIVRDSTAAPTGRYDVCYVNGFQTQPQDARAWRTEAPQLLVRRAGKPYRDPGWPGEYLLDVSTVAKRRAILDRVAPTIRLCAAKGFDAVEIDNLDSWTRAHGAFGIAGAVAMARSYARLAHRLGLAIGQKNAAGHSARMKRQVGFDFAISEECLQYRECGDYLAAYGQRTYDIEYRGLDCAAARRPEAVILRDRELRTPRSPAYVRRAC
jgi:hypothetical protein